MGTRPVQLRGLPAWDLILSLNLCFESVLRSPMGKWPMSLSLKRQPILTLSSHCVPRTASRPYAPPRLTICEPCPEIRNHNQVTLIGRETHIPCLPQPSALGWGLGGSVRRVSAPSRGEARLWSSQHRAGSTVVNWGRNLSGSLSLTPSRGTENFSAR